MIAGVTVALVVYNEQENIKRALASLEAPPHPWEILVVDNGSTDGTREEVRRFQGKHPEVSIRWLDHRPNNLGAARALAVKEAGYSWIGFLDADCLAPPGWVKNFCDALLAHEKDPLILGVGSGNIPPCEGDPFNQALAIQLSSPLGHLNSPQARQLRSPGEVGHLPTCNVYYFRDRVLLAGNFSSAYRLVCEDLDLSLRAREMGFKLIYQPGLEVVHFQKPSWLGWAAKMFRYGWGQIDLARIHPEHLFGMKAIPLLAALIALGWGAAHLTSFVFFLLFYLGVTGIYSTFLCFKSAKPHLSAHVFLLFVTTHVFYSAGELWGVFRQIKNREVNQRKRKQSRLPH